MQVTLFFLRIFAVHWHMLFYERPKHPDFIIFMFVEIKPILTPISYLKKIIIQAFFWNSYFFSCRFKFQPIEISLAIFFSIIIFSPFHNFFNYVAYSSFFRSAANFLSTLLFLFFMALTRRLLIYFSMISIFFHFIDSFIHFFRHNHMD